MSELDWQVARVGAEALDAIAAIGAACFDPSWSRPALAAELEVDGARAWIAREAAAPGRALAFLLMMRVADEAEIRLLGVEPEARRRGAGSALLAAALTEEAASGARRIHLEVRAGNRAARELYARAGFVIVGRRACYYRDGEDALLLTLSLPASRGGATAVPPGLALS